MATPALVNVSSWAAILAIRRRDAEQASSLRKARLSVNPPGGARPSRGSGVVAISGRSSGCDDDRDRHGDREQHECKHDDDGRKSGAVVRAWLSGRSFGESFSGEVVVRDGAIVMVVDVLGEKPFGFQVVDRASRTSDGGFGCETHRGPGATALTPPMSSGATAMRRPADSRVSGEYPRPRGKTRDSRTGSCSMQSLPIVHVAQPGCEQYWSNDIVYLRRSAESDGAWLSGDCPFRRVSNPDPRAPDPAPARGYVGRLLERQQSESDCSVSQNRDVAPHARLSRGVM